MKKKYNYDFVIKFKLANLCSLALVISSFLLIFSKGLNYGIDFKGGTLMEVRIVSENITISDVRSSFSKMNLGDLNVKEFGKKGDYLIKFEKKTSNKNDDLKIIKKNFTNDIQGEVNFRRVENVGPKVSAELLR